MKQILCLLLNNWPIERVRRKVPQARREPLVLVRSVANRQEVVAVCEDAFKRGMRIGMTLAQTRALCADVNWLEHEPQRDAQSLEALGRWLMRFSPIVQPYQWNGRHGIFLDLTGCERVFNGLDILEAELVAAVNRLRITGQCAIAATMGAAWALAHRSTPCSRRVCSPISAERPTSSESAGRPAGYTRAGNSDLLIDPWSRRSCATPFGKQHPTLRGEKPGKIIADFLEEMESSPSPKDVGRDSSHQQERCDKSHPTTSPFGNERATVRSTAAIQKFCDLPPSSLYAGERDRGRGVLQELDGADGLKDAARTNPSLQPSPLNTGKREDALAPLPVHTLRIAPESAELLHQLGITTIGQLLKLPRETLPARFGDGLLLRIDQALGHVAEPLLPLNYFTPISAKMEFEGPVDSLEAIFLIFKRLLVQIVKDLQRRGEGAREIEAKFYRPYAVTLTKTIRLSNPSREPKNLFNLLRCALEMLETDVGFLGVKLKVTRSQRLSEEQIDLMEREQFVDAQELLKVVERLQIRLGECVITQPKLIESHLPEKRFETMPAGQQAIVPKPTKQRSASHPTIESRPKLDLGQMRFAGEFSPFSSDKDSSVALSEETVLRPLHLFSPQPIQVTVDPYYAPDGKPAQFSWRGMVHKLNHVVGPERISGLWWQNHRKTRDYFNVENESGCRYWIFHVVEGNRWFVQGEFG